MCVGLWNFRFCGESLALWGESPIDFLTWAGLEPFLRFLVSVEALKPKLNFISRKRPALVLFLLPVSCFYIVWNQAGHLIGLATMKRALFDL